MTAADFKPVRVAVVGAGHLGKEHARIYAQSPLSELVAVCDENPETAKRVAEAWNVPATTDFRTLENIEAVSVCVPTVSHFEVASHFIRRGVHVLVEKPMTKTIDEADELLRLAAEHKVALQVGHIERFNPALMGAMPYIQDPKYIESYRISPFSFRSADVGVVLDLMIHDLDIVLFLVNSPVKSVDAIGVPVLAAKEDVANARIEFENGCVANLTASRVSLKRERVIRGFFGNSYISLDYDKKRGVIYRKNEAFARGDIGIEDIRLNDIADIRTFAFDKFISIEEIPMDRFEPLARELESFLESVRTGMEPIVSGRHGRAAMAAATKIISIIDERLQHVRPDPR